MKTTLDMNPLFMVDCYKIAHPFMYDPSMTLLESNMTARSDKRFNGSKYWDHKVVVAGVSGLVKEYFVEAFNRNFFSQPIDEVLKEYINLFDGVFGPGVISAEHIEALHKLQKLPMRVDALPEGSRVNIGVPFIRIKPTVKGFAWLTNYLETLVSNYLWPSITNATIAFEFRRVLEQAAIDTVGEANPFVVGYQAHDFSLRGIADRTGSTGFGHLLSFIGSDNVPAIWYAKNLYNAKNSYIAGSVPATEHSVASSNILNIAWHLENWGHYEDIQRNNAIPVKEQAEEIFITKMITKVFPTGIFSYVTDTFDYWGVLTNILPRIKDVVLNRKDTDTPVPTRLVIRPDSGNPVNIICGYRVAPDECYPGDLWEYDVIKENDKYYFFDETYDWDGYADGYTLTDEVPLHEVKGSIEVLWDLFGGTVTAKGYKQLNSKIGLIYGDSITLKNLQEILDRLKAKGFASTNVIFGIGSFTYQFNTRDTFGQAIKATHATFVDADGEEYSVDLFKDPKTGDKEKKSAKGRLAVFKTDTGFELKQGATLDEQDNDAMETFYEYVPDLDYVFVREEFLDDIRVRLLGELKNEG